MKTMNYDLLCVGGGLSGFSLAVKSASEGKKVLVVERNEFLGGSAVSGFCIDKAIENNPVIAELVSNLEKRNGIRRTSDGTSYDIVNPELVKFCALEMCKEKQIDVLFHTVVSSVEVFNGKIKACQLFGKGTYCTVTAETYADATGCGELAAIAGLKEAKTSSFSADYSFTVCNYQQESSDFRLPQGVSIEKSAEEGRLLVKLSPISIDRYDSMSISETLYGFSCKALELLDYLRSNVKGFEECKISSVPPMLNVKSDNSFENNLDNLLIVG